MKGLWWQARGVEGEGKGRGGKGGGRGRDMYRPVCYTDDVENTRQGTGEKTMEHATKVSEEARGVSGV